MHQFGRLLLSLCILQASFRKNFYEIMTQEEIFEWLKGPLLGGAYPETSYTDRPLSLIDQQYILGYYRLVGGIRLRQARVTNTSCTSRRLLQLCKDRPDVLDQTTREGVDSSCLGRFDNLDGTCFAEFVSTTDLISFAPASEATEPFERNGNVYNWTSGLSQLDGLFGWFQSYGNGGYLVELPTDATAAAAIVDQLEQDRFLDRASRALEVAMNLYNTNTRLLTVVRIMFEMMPTGHVIRWARIYSVPALQYRSAQDRARAFFEVIFVVFILYYVQKSVRRIYRDHAGGIGVVRAVVRATTLFELVLAALAAVMIVQWFRFITSPKIVSFDVNMPEYTDLYDEAESFILTLSWAGMVGLGASFRMFQFLSISKRMNTMWLTIKQGIVDLAAFGVSFALVIAGFSLWGEMSFGFFLEDFRTFWGSASALARFTLGTWNYEELRVARPAFAGVFFSLYSALMTISLLNMIIGIIETSFSEVLDIVETADRWKENTQPVEAACIERCRVGSSLCCRRLCGRALMPGDSDVRSERVMAARDRFNSALHVCMRKAKREGTDLFTHFDNVYDEADKDDALYISWHELASLLYKGQTFTPTVLYCKGSTRHAQGIVAEATSGDVSPVATVANPIRAAAAAASSTTQGDAAAPPSAGGGGSGTGGAGGQLSAAELQASRAAAATERLDMLVHTAQNEVKQQPMSEADCSVVFEPDEMDVPEEECGPCLFRLIFPCCTTGTVSNGRRKWTCFGLCPHSGGATAGIRGATGSSSGRASSGGRASRSRSGDERNEWRELRQLMKSYIDMRRVYFVPAARKHLRAKEEQDARGKRPIRVTKRINGRETSRGLVIDEQRAELLSFDSRDNLRKRLPLTKLVSVDMAGIDETSLSLVFTSNGVPSAQEAKFGSLELVFDVKFSREDDRKRFYDELWLVANKLHSRLLQVAQHMVAEPAQAAMLLSKQGVESPHVQVSHFTARARSAKRMHEVSKSKSSAAATFHVVSAVARAKAGATKGAAALHKAMSAGAGGLAAAMRRAAAASDRSAVAAPEGASAPHSAAGVAQNPPPPHSAAAAAAAAMDDSDDDDDAKEAPLFG